jgi:uncharacterized HAD superfamily protein
MKRLGVDVDGVIASFSGRFVQMANKRFGTSYTELDQHDWDFQPWFSKAQVDAVWVDINATENFWQTLRPLEGTSRLRWPIPNRELVFITSRTPTRGHSVHNQTCAWLREHFHITYPFVIVVDNPSEKLGLIKNLGIDNFIDDKLSTVLQLNEAGIRSYLKLAPYNSAKPLPEGIIPVLDLNDYLEQELKIG